MHMVMDILITPRQTRRFDDATGLGTRDRMNRLSLSVFYNIPMQQLILTKGTNLG